MGAGKALSHRTCNALFNNASDNSLFWLLLPYKKEQEKAHGRVCRKVTARLKRILIMAIEKDKKSAIIEAA
jgi:hypothetical protein